MAFNIDSLLEDKAGAEANDVRFELADLEEEEDQGELLKPDVDSQVNWNFATSQFGLNSIYAIANDIKTPSLVELQMLFGVGVRKHEYRRSRKAVCERKPRQAYSSSQLDKLEQEFQQDKYLSVNKRIQLSKTLNLTETQIKTWFQNRRTKWKKQITSSIKQIYRQNTMPGSGGPLQLVSPTTCMSPSTAPTLFEPTCAPPPMSPSEDSRAS
ncbi:hypothetical protein L596_004469 [Steinernema carpocapsae]|uniref:Homeobox domain-containing protein n=1 Tax=Steinernema carpocapsae TaxID=34508 RepID=A0A4U8UW11_STECR|nr:hypothetical protein L596_004469 [Steinernema carpocapsae]